MRHRLATSPCAVARRFAAALAAAVMLPVASASAEETDLREFRVGMPVSALPASGYTGLACAREPQQALAGWADWRACPADPSGLRAVSFRYDDATNDLALIDEDEAGTKVAGHPVLLEHLVAEDAHVAGLRIVTDP